MSAHKTYAAGSAGAVTVILVWIAGIAGLDVPPEVASASTTLLAAAAVYYTRNRRRIVVKGEVMIALLVSILFAALAYWVCLALGLPPLIGVIAALLVLLGGAGGYRRA